MRDGRLMQFYDEAIARFGADDPQGVGWGTPSGQIERFSILAEIADLNGASILDVGCGFGDLYGYLRQRGVSVSYTGIDINPHAIAIAEEKYPDAQFEVADFETYDGAGADYVLASGALTYKIENYRAVYLGFIEKMFGLSDRGCGFNMLKRGHHTDDDTYATYDPMDIYSVARSLTSKLILREEYLPQDFTFYLYH